MADKLIDLLVDDHRKSRRRVKVLGLDVYVTMLTVGESAQVTAKHPNDSAQRQAEILVLKCRDADGNPIFTKDDKPKLMRQVSGDRLGELFAAINGASVGEQAEK